MATYRNNTSVNPTTKTARLSEPGGFFCARKKLRTMAYTSGMMNKRVKVAKRAADAASGYGKGAAGVRYSILGEFWAAEDYNKGVKSLREGAYDAYDTVMFRMRYHNDIDRWCLIQYQGRWYQIQSFNANYQDNQIQITAMELANQQVTIVEE